jgi:protein-export membrane protein SecD
LILTIVLVGLAIYVNLDVDHPTWFENLQWWRREDPRSIALRYGLDLQGGTMALLVADVPDDQELDPDALETARQIIKDRIGAIGLSEPVVQILGDRRILVEFPAVDDPDLVIETLRGTALMEFVDTGGAFLAPGEPIHTTIGGAPADTTSDALASMLGQTDLDPLLAPIGPEYTPPLSTPSSILSPTDILTPTTPISPTGPSAPTEPTTPTVPAAPVTIHQTLLTGAELDQVDLARDQSGGYAIAFVLNPAGTAVFDGFTTSHAPSSLQSTPYPLCVSLDNVIVACPSIPGRIPNGQGSFSLVGASYQVASSLVAQFRYGAHPVPLRVETSSPIGPNLGEISVEQSARAGFVGLLVVMLFMLVYYRLPGLVADLAMLAYAVINLALYKVIPITLTLPGIAGLLLSAVVMVGSNVLIFERIKEEIRAGRSLRPAIEAGFEREWTAILSSHISVWLFCLVLFYISKSFGTGVVVAFVTTLAFGTAVSVFTAVAITRTLIHLVVHLAGDWLALRRWLLGV